MKNTVKKTMKDRIVVVGSANMDMVISAADFPQPGETLTGYGFMTNHGGKGANQAVAAARLGANVSFVGVLGGCIWGLGTVFSYIAAGKAGASISYALGQGAPMIAALWGVFIWKEFKGSNSTVNALLALMFVLFITGVGMIVAAGN